MLRPRLIPCLLIDDGRLVKTRRFAEPKYVGDPINTVRIFNEKVVDELVVLDIGASKFRKEPDYQLIEKLASVCRMPLCYGGGVTQLHQVEALISLGVEKVSISTAFHENPKLISDSASRVGNQSIVVTLDVRIGSGDKYQVYKQNGTVNTHTDATEAAKQAESLGAGEVVINNIDRDGELSGYDLRLIKMVRDAVSVPITAVGGAASPQDFAALARMPQVGAAAGSYFVFRGKFRAVLISYPTTSERHQLGF